MSSVCSKEERTTVASTVTRKAYNKLNIEPLNLVQFTLQPNVLAYFVSHCCAQILPRCCHFLAMLPYMIVAWYVFLCWS